MMSCCDGGDYVPNSVSHHRREHLRYHDRGVIIVMTLISPSASLGLEYVVIRESSIDEEAIAD